MQQKTSGNNCLAGYTWQKYVTPPLGLNGQKYERYDWYKDKNPKVNNYTMNPFKKGDFSKSFCPQ